jgi:ComF family protein
MEKPVLAPVPLHPARQRERRFNQSAALAEWVSHRLDLPVEQPLRRKVHTITQTQFDRRQRMRNLRDAFALRHNAAVKDKNFLLVDDVLTTGSTLDECARVLLEGGARSVRAITVARG